MNAAIGGIHRDTRNEICHWSELCADYGAINDMRFFNLLEEAREVAASFVNLQKDDVAFSGSTSLNMNFLAMMLKKSGVKKVIAPINEFPSSTLAWFHHGFEVDLVEDHNGKIIEEELLERTKGSETAVVCSAVQFLSGQKMDLSLLSNGLADKGAHFVINGTQHLGQFPLDLSQLKYTAFTASLHKWLGADLGVSLLTLPKESREIFSFPIAGWTSVEEPWRLANEPPKLLSDTGVFQSGTIPFNSIAGVKKAMEVQLEIGKEHISKRVLDLSEKLRKTIIDAGFKMYSPDSSVSGINTFYYEKDLDKALAIFEEKKVFVNGRKGKIRASIHFYNDESDISLFTEALKSI